MKNLTLIIVLICSSFIGYGQQFKYQPDSAFKQQIIKVEFFSPLTGNLTLGYERYLKNSTSIEAKLGIIGIGQQSDISAKGAFIKIGPKFKLEPEYATSDLFGTHLLRGQYIRPEIIVGHYRMDDNIYDSRNEQRDITAFSIMINYGKQHVLGKIMSIDWYMGIGYGFSNEDGESYYFSHFSGNGSYPIAFNAGFTLGFLFK